MSFIMDRFVDLVKKKLAGELTGEDEAELNQLLNSDEEHKELYSILLSNIPGNKEVNWTTAEEAMQHIIIKCSCISRLDLEQSVVSAI